MTDTTPNKNPSEKNIDKFGDLDDDLLDEVDLDAVDLESAFSQDSGDIENPAAWGTDDKKTAESDVYVESKARPLGAKKKNSKSSSGLFIVVGSVVVLGIGSWFAFSTLMDKSTTPSPSETSTLQSDATQTKIVIPEPPMTQREISDSGPMTPMPRPNATPPDANSSEVQESFFLNPDALESQLNATALTQDSPAIQKDSITRPVIEGNGAAPLPVAIPQPVKEIHLNPGVSDQEPIPSAPRNTEIKTAPDQILTTIPANDSDLMRRLDALESAQKEADKKTLELTNTLSRLERKLDDMIAMPARDSYTKPARPLITSKEKSVPKSSQVPKNTKPKSLVVQKSHRTSTTPARQARPSAVRWELRSASQGQALVSKSGGADVYTLTIGANLPGIGRIVSITQDNGHWVVKGTQGQIVQ